MDQWILSGGYKMIGFAMLAGQQCRSDVEEIQRQQRQTIIEMYQNEQQ
jgi:hypothetical protein